MSLTCFFPVCCITVTCFFSSLPHECDCFSSVSVTFFPVCCMNVTCFSRSLHGHDFFFLQFLIKLDLFFLFVAWVWHVFPVCCSHEWEWANQPTALCGYVHAPDGTHHRSGWCGEHHLWWQRHWACFRRQHDSAVGIPRVHGFHASSTVPFPCLFFVSIRSEINLACISSIAASHALWLIYFEFS